MAEKMTFFPVILFFDEGQNFASKAVKHARLSIFYYYTLQAS